VKKPNTATLVALMLGINGTTCWGQHATGEEKFTMALTGDSIITRKLSVHKEPQFPQLIRSADIAFTNLGMLFHDYEPYPMAESGGTWMRGDRSLAEELAWAGFDLVARANNHTGDYGVPGMDLTTRYVAEAGIVQAGVEHSLAEAREAKFAERKLAKRSLPTSASARHPTAPRFK